MIVKIEIEKFGDSIILTNKINSKKKVIIKFFV